MAAVDRLTVLCVSPDRALLRQLANLLDTFGYRAISCADLARAGKYQSWAHAEICIVDSNRWEDSQRIVADLRQQSGEFRPAMLLTCDVEETLDPMKALEAGVDEILARPLRNAEVLTRLRVAARLREFDRRIAGQAIKNPRSGLPSERGLVLRMRQIGQLQNWSSSAAIIVLESDLFAERAASCGEEASRALEDSLAALLTEHTKGPHEIAGHTGPGRFALAAWESSRELARKRAEDLRHVMSRAGSETSTLSAGVAVSEAGDSDVSALLQRANLALRMAQDNGRDDVVVSDDFQMEWDQWRECVQHGNPFSQNTAKDFMTAFTLWLTPSDTMAKAVGALKRTQLPLLPVLDDSGQLRGLILAEQVKVLQEKGAARPLATIRDVMSSDFRRRDINCDYDEVMRLFLNANKTPIVFCKDDLPQGFVTFASFVGMVSPVGPRSFSSGLATTGSTSLIVPDHVPALAEPSSARAR